MSMSEIRLYGEVGQDFVAFFVVDLFDLTVWFYSFFDILVINKKFVQTTRYDDRIRDQ